MVLDEVTSLDGQRVIITGGTTGIGRAIATSLVRRGCRVFIGGRDPQHLEEALAEIGVNGDKASGFLSDLATIEGVTALFDAAQNWLGAIDIVILNAGLGSHGQLSTLSHEECRRVVNVNLLSTIHGALEAIQRMEGRRGQIVMTGSMSAELFDVNAAVYTATKSGIRGFAGSLRKEANPLGIRVSLIEPGSTGSEMVDESPEEKRRMQEASTMLRPEDVARAVLFVLTQPERSDVIQLQVRPHRQLI